MFVAQSRQGAGYVEQPAEPHKTPRLTVDHHSTQVGPIRALCPKASGQSSRPWTSPWVSGRALSPQLPSTWYCRLIPAVAAYQADARVLA